MPQVKLGLAMVDVVRSTAAEKDVDVGVRIGLHTGEPVSVTLHPAEINHGVVFSRLEAEGTVRIPALVEHVVDTQLASRPLVTVVGRVVAVAVTLNAQLVDA